MATKHRPQTLAFLAVNASYAHSNLAEWFLKAGIASHTWRWVSLETTVNDDRYDLLGRLAAIEADVIAASVYLFNRDFLAQVLRRLKKLRPHTVIIGGGPEFLGDNRGLFGHGRWLDAVVRGEGERAFCALLNAWKRPGMWRTIPGVCYADAQGYHDGGAAEPVADLDALPSPYASSLAGFRKPFVQIETSRGCANTCAFCVSGIGSAVRRHAIDRVRRDLDDIRVAGVPYVRVLDRTFNDLPRRSIALLRMFRDEYPEIRFHLEIDPARITKSFLAELAQAAPDRFHLEVGVQALQPAVYRAVGRRATVGRTLDGVVRLCALRQAVHADLVAGLPAATWQDLRNDLRRIVGLAPETIQVELLKALPGTRLRREATAWSLVYAPDPPYEVLQTSTMTHAELQQARRLGQAVDWFYNALPLQPVTQRASGAIENFWELLLPFIEARVAPGTGPGLDQRFRLLDGFFAAHPAEHRHRLHYAWLRHGLSARQGIVAAFPWKNRLPSGAALVEGDPAVPPSRFVRAALDADYIFAYAAGEGAGRQACAVYRL